MSLMVIGVRCERISCTFNFEGRCCPYEDNKILCISKTGKCNCYKRLKKITIEQLKKELEAQGLKKTVVGNCEIYK